LLCPFPYAKAINHTIKAKIKKLQSERANFMRRLGSVIAAAAILWVGQAMAADKECYQAKEAEAEQGLRIQSELMVTSLNCEHMSQRSGRSLYAAYQDFERTHASQLRTYESVLLSFFKSVNDPAPEARLTSLMTSLADKVSREVAVMRPDVFCSRNAQRVEKASALSPEAFSRWAATPG
jgi:hypothetical protein